MKIILNGIEHSLKGDKDIRSVLITKGYADKLVAVALNGTFVAREFYEHTMINEGDKIEIVAPMQGG